MELFILIIKFKHYIIDINNMIYYLNGDWGLGIGDWGLGIGDWAQSPIPNPQSPYHIIYVYYIMLKFNY
jgi:hypothetical protein